MVLLEGSGCHDFLLKSLHQSTFPSIYLFLYCFQTNKLFIALFSVNPKPCGYGCECYFAQDKGNTFQCKHLTYLPPNNVVPNNTDYLQLSANNITELYGTQLYLRNILGLTLKNGRISSVSENILYSLERGRIQTLDLTNNKIQTLPQAIRLIESLTDVGLSGNPLVCNCDTLWMKDWLMTFNQSRRDLLRVKCSNNTPRVTIRWFGMCQKRATDLA